MTQLGFDFSLGSLVKAHTRVKRKPGARGPQGSGAIQLLLLLDPPHAQKILPPTGAAPAPAPQEIAPAAPPRDEQDPVPTIRGQIRLEQALRRLTERPVLVALHTNTSTVLSFRRKGRALYVRAHAMFQDAPEEVLHALALFVSNELMPEHEGKILDGWIERHRSTLTRDRVRAVQIQPFGEVHNLREIYDRLNAEYFEGKVEAQITWSRAARHQRRSTIHMGTYAHDLRLIRIHPALDQDWVAQSFVEFVVFHEMLHQVHHATDDDCERRSVHTPAFRAQERTYKRYDEAREWERLHLTRLLRY